MNTDYEDYLDAIISAHKKHANSIQGRAEIYAEGVDYNGLLQPIQIAINAFKVGMSEALKEHSSLTPDILGLGITD